MSINIKRNQLKRVVIVGADSVVFAWQKTSARQTFR